MRYLDVSHRKVVSMTSYEYLREKDILVMTPINDQSARMKGAWAMIPLWRVRGNKTRLKKISSIMPAELDFSDGGCKIFTQDESITVDILSDAIFDAIKKGR